MGSTKYPAIPPLTGGTPALPGAGQPGPMLPGEFKPGSRPNWTQFKFKDIDPPASIYVQRDDILLLQAVTILPGGDTVTFNARFLRTPDPAGGQPSDAGNTAATGNPYGTAVIVTDQQTLNLTTPSIAVTRIVQQQEGELLSLGAVSANGTSRGQTFVFCKLLRGAAATVNTAYTLINDYVTQGQTVGWPGGRQIGSVESSGWKRSVNVANPAAGADWTFTSSGFQRTRVESLHAVFTASAGVANRNVEIIVQDGLGNIVWIDDLNASITAAQVIDVVATGTNVPTGVVTTVLHCVIPPGLILAPTWAIRTNTVNIQAADQWSVIWLNVEQWIDGF